MKRVAVVLSGCGFLDGAEITEAVSLLIHLDRRGLGFSCFAPDIPQSSVVNHATHTPGVGSRNVLEESARIARGKIAPLASLKAADFDALVFPGGFGAAKNLCDFAAKGPECSVQSNVARTLREFHAAKKPIGLCCIAPVLAARVLGTTSGGPGCTLTIGSDPSTAAALSKMGASNIDHRVTEAHLDAKNLIVSTPAYMCESGPFGVFTGIGALVDELAKLLGVR
ncbi:MAG: isoprenoid biosynthesis glyoxalase ElbB [Phycisphaerae bacterium]|nr:isoprenoid biosynthesis glyoxalase ElbB [Phycisphaerae bacterium]